MKKVVVVIPVHSPKPGERDLISLTQCCKVLADYEIVLLHPEGLDLSEYQCHGKEIKSVGIEKQWFTSHRSYNQLKKSLRFYDLFSDYEYLLTYELDCFVFRDELSYWCNKGYDYIGAPWFDNYTGAHQRIVGVGNSGFSLRKVSTCRTILKTNRYRNGLLTIVRQHFKSGKSLKTLMNPVRLYEAIKRDSSFNLYNTFVGHEDAFWCLEIPKYFPEFNIAPVEDAYRFSIEEQPEYLVQLNNNQLPFGCHAWYRFDYWKSVFPRFGYSI